MKVEVQSSLRARDFQTLQFFLRWMFNLVQSETDFYIFGLGCFVSFTGPAYLGYRHSLSDSLITRKASAVRVLITFKESERVVN